MTDSSPENNQEPQEQATGDEQTVPVKAVAKERAEKRAAKAEAAGLKEQLEQMQSQEGFDMNALVQSLGEVVNASANSAVEEALRPEREKNARLQMALEMGLSTEQANAVGEVMSKYQGMSQEEALTLARSQHNDLFAQQAQGFNPSHAGAPVSGSSPTRSSGPQEDLMGKIRDATTREERQYWTMKEFQRRITTAKNR